MAAPRGRRTRHVTVYLSPAESAAWDLARRYESGWGWAGLAPPSRAAWVMERVCADLARQANGDAAEERTRLAIQALDAIDQEEHEVAYPDRSHGRPPRP